METVLCSKETPPSQFNADCDHQRESIWGEQKVIVARSLHDQRPLKIVVEFKFKPKLNSWPFPPVSFANFHCQCDSSLECSSQC